MEVSLQVVQIILSITLVALVLLQAKGSGLGSAFGDGGGIYRTRRGVEKLLFQATIGISVGFALLSLISVTYFG